MDAWTDERLDDLAASLRPLPAEIARLSEQLASNNAQLANNTEEIRLMRQDLLALHRMLAQIGWGFGAAVLVALVGLVVAAA